LEYISPITWIIRYRNRFPSSDPGYYPWSVEKKDPGAAVSEPVKPIIYYVDPATPDQWLKSAKMVADSWWPSWEKWVAKFGGGSVKARVPGDAKLKVIEDAPGSYVAVRLQ